MLIGKIFNSSQAVQLLKYSSPISHRLFSSINVRESSVGLQRNCTEFSINHYRRSVHSLCNSFTNLRFNNDTREDKLLGKQIAFVEQRRGYAMRLELSEYGLLWKRPEYIPSWRPEHSLDLVPFEEPDKTLPVVSLLNIKSEIAKADEKTQRLMSIEYNDRKEILNMALYLMRRRIQRHKYDNDSLEVKISHMTVLIRYFQPIIAVEKKKVKLRIKIKVMIERRKGMLRILRKMDYKKFEWLLEELGLVYKPIPTNNERISRKGALKKLVDLHCEKIRQDKLEMYRQELEVLKKPFLNEKRETLKWIAETEKRLGLPISVEVPEEPEMKQLGDGGIKNSQDLTKEL